MKIGILTFHKGDNYGGLLQAYALKFTLCNMGHTANVINYYCWNIEKGNALFVPLKMLTFKGLVRRAVNILCLPLFLYIRSRYDVFRKKYLLDTPLFTARDLSKETVNYDLFISGSDQVLNPRLTGFDNIYYLSFALPRQRCSYAASFGLSSDNLSSKEKAFIQKYLLGFLKLSLRETEGKVLAKEVGYQDPQVHVDPTLIFTKEDWTKIAIIPKQKRKYILMYLMHYDPILIQFATELAKNKKYQLIYIAPVIDLHFIKAKHIYPTPQEWLGWFLKAEYIITNSFHGLAFAVNFNKLFFVGKLPSSWGTNSRLKNLLDLLGLDNREYGSLSSEEEKPIDWERVNMVIDQERKRALNYLKEITNI